MIIAAARRKFKSGFLLRQKIRCVVKCSRHILLISSQFAKHHHCDHWSYIKLYTTRFVKRKHHTSYTAQKVSYSIRMFNYIYLILNWPSTICFNFQTGNCMLCRGQESCTWLKKSRPKKPKVNNHIELCKVVKVDLNFPLIFYRNSKISFSFWFYYC